MKNELARTEKLDALVTEQVREMIDQYKYINEQMDTFKFIVKQLMEKNGIGKWDHELFTITLTNDTTTTKIDTAKLKETKIMITDALTGELMEVNAYDFFTYRTTQKGSFRMKVKEEKYGG